MLTVTHTHNRRGSAHCNPHAHKKGLLTHHYVRKECMRRVQGEQRTKSAENKDWGECRVWEDEDKIVQEKGDRTVRENGESRRWRRKVWANGECKRTERVGCGRSKRENVGEQRV